MIGCTIWDGVCHACRAYVDGSKTNLCDNTYWLKKLISLASIYFNCLLYIFVKFSEFY